VPADHLLLEGDLHLVPVLERDANAARHHIATPLHPCRPLGGRPGRVRSRAAANNRN
jgi:hypothetical protein